MAKTGGSFGGWTGGKPSRMWADLPPVVKPEPQPTRTETARRQFFQPRGILAECAEYIKCPRCQAIPSNVSVTADPSDFRDRILLTWDNPRRYGVTFMPDPRAWFKSSEEYIAEAFDRMCAVAQTHCEDIKPSDMAL